MIRDNSAYFSIKMRVLFHKFDQIRPRGDNDAKRRVYGRDLAKKQKCSVPCSVLFSSRYIDGKKIFRQRFVSGSG